MPIAPPLVSRGNTSVINETLVVTSAAEPKPIIALQPTSHQNDGDTDARRHATPMVARPMRYIRFLPIISPRRARGTMNTTDDRRKAVFTYASM